MDELENCRNSLRKAEEDIITLKRIKVEYEERISRFEIKIDGTEKNYESKIVSLSNEIERLNGVLRSKVEENSAL